MNHIDQRSPAYRQGERKAHEDLDRRGPTANLTAWLHLAELIAARIDSLEAGLAEIQAVPELAAVVRTPEQLADSRHEIAGYIATLRDHLAEQADR